MNDKNLDIVLETPKTVTLVDGTEISFKPLSVKKSLSFIDLAVKFRVNITADLTQSPETRKNVLAATEMMIKNSDYPKDKDWQDDDDLGMQEMQDIIDLGLKLNLPQLKSPRT